MEEVITHWGALSTTLGYTVQCTNGLLSISHTHQQSCGVLKPSTWMAGEKHNTVLHSRGLLPMSPFPVSW